MFVFQIRTVQEMDKELFFFNVLRKDSVLKYWINFVYSKTYNVLILIYRTLEIKYCFHLYIRLYI